MEDEVNPLVTKTRQLKQGNSSLEAGQEDLRKSNSDLMAGQAVLETEVVQIKRHIARLGS